MGCNSVVVASVRANPAMLALARPSIHPRRLENLSTSDSESLQ